MCGHCTGATIDDCVYCSRDPATTKAHYSLTYGNCTCVSGYFYDATAVQCRACDLRCAECYGPDKTDCLTCASGKPYFPTNICVDDCQDTLVVGDGSIGYYTGSDTVGGTSFPVCVKCHPYCKICTGPNNGECSVC